jgi:hypothetical protein
MESKRESDHQQGSADFDLVKSIKQVLWCEGPIERGSGQRNAIDFDCRDVDLTGGIKTLRQVWSVWQHAPSVGGHAGLSVNKDGAAG